MVSLSERLLKIKQGFLKQAPEAAVEIMSRATNDLRESGIMDRIPKVGEWFPDFSLENTEGIRLSLDDLLAKSPLVITIYRGVW